MTAPEAENDAGPVDAHGVGGERAESCPGMDVLFGSALSDLQFEVRPATGFVEAEDRNQQSSSPDQKELQHFIKDGRAQPAQ